MGTTEQMRKGTTELEPAMKTTTIAKLHRLLRDNMKAERAEWVAELANKPMTGRYAIADRMPPSLAGSHAFRTLVVTQARTGHDYFGEYYQTHNIQEPFTRPCSAELQTRKPSYK